MPAGSGKAETPGEWLEYSPLLTVLISALGLAYLYREVATGGLRVLPNYTFSNAPHPDVVVIGAQEGTAHLSEWLRARATDSRVVMSVCTGAFKLANAGLLDGKKATTHHEFWETFAKKFPKVDLQRGNRFVQSSDVIYTADGLTSGIDLALHIVEKFYGSEAADRTAAYMEHRRSSAKNSPI